VLCTEPALGTNIPGAAVIAIATVARWKRPCAVPGLVIVSMPLGRTASLDNSQERQTAIRSRAKVPSPSPRSETARRLTSTYGVRTPGPPLRRSLRMSPDWAGSLFVVPIELDERDVSLN
jgi:hypothetical protein